MYPHSRPRPRCFHDNSRLVGLFWATTNHNERETNYPSHRRLIVEKLDLASSDRRLGNANRALSRVIAAPILGEMRVTHPCWIFRVHFPFVEPSARDGWEVTQKEEAPVASLPPSRWKAPSQKFERKSQRGTGFGENRPYSLLLYLICRNSLSLKRCGRIGSTLRERNTKAAAVAFCSRPFRTFFSRRLL